MKSYLESAEEMFLIGSHHINNKNFDGFCAAKFSEIAYLLRHMIDLQESKENDYQEDSEDEWICDEGYDIAEPHYYRKLPE